MSAIEAATAPVRPFDPEQYRRDFPIFAQGKRNGRPLAYLDNAATTQHPRQVIEAVAEAYQRYYANVHRGIHWLADRTTELYEAARDKIRQFLNAAHREEIVFTSGATAAINLVARSWGDANLRPGDAILVSEMEHHSNLVPWYQLAQRTGAVVRHLPLLDDGQLDLAQLDTLLQQRTRLVAITAVSNVLGTINPLEEIIRRAHAAGALVLVDGAQSVPHLPTDVAAMDADFLAFSGHKMLGPSGIGVLYGKRELLESMPPFLGGGSMIREVTLEGFEPADVPTRFEAGTPPIVPAIGLGAALDYLGAIPRQEIVRHERLLTQRTHELLGAIPGIRLVGPAVEHKAGIVSFVLDRVHAHDLAQILDRYNVAVRAGHHCAMPLHRRYGLTATTRASFYFYNTLAEVEALAEGVQHAQRLFARRK